MGRTFRYGDEDDEQILGPGDRLVVPMALMDSMDQRTASIEEAKRSTYRAGERLGLHNRPDVRITDVAGDSGLALHRPGYRVADGIQRDMSVYAAYDAEAEAAYKNVGAGKREAQGQRVGDVCTVSTGGGRFGPEGARGHLKMINGELTCVADQQEDAASFKDEREAAYAAKDEYYRAAYRRDGQ